ncbi:MAG: hypothetical protein Q4C46_10215 [Bacillota bacterium]|nr:hypothetical protein [Bacillota bacterium]
MADRLYIEKSRKTEIRDISKRNDYLKFENQKELFMYAMALGMDCYNGGTINSGEGLFLAKDMHIEDQAFMNAIVSTEVDSLEDLNNTDLVFKKAEGIADKGFSVILDEIDGKNTETLILTMLKRTNELFNEAKQEGLLDID